MSAGAQAASSPFLRCTAGRVGAHWPSAWVWPQTSEFHEGRDKAPGLLQGNPSPNQGLFRQWTGPPLLGPTRRLVLNIA